MTYYFGKFGLVGLAGIVFAAGSQPLHAQEDFDIHAINETIEGIKDLIDSSALRRKNAEITIAVSNSLAKDYLAKLSAALERTGGRMVVRGIDVREVANDEGVAFAGGSDERFAAANRFARDFESAPFFALDRDKQKRVRERIGKGLRAMAQKTQAAGFEIDPQFFRTHRIDAVPVFVVRIGSINDLSTKEKAGNSCELDVKSAASAVNDKEASREGETQKIDGQSRTYIVRGAVDLGWALEKMASCASDQGYAEDARALLQLSDSAFGVINSEKALASTRVYEAPARQGVLP